MIVARGVVLVKRGGVGVKMGGGELAQLRTKVSAIVSDVKIGKGKK